MTDDTQSTGFQPERVKTFSNWRLPNFAPPVDEKKLRDRFEKNAKKANAVFDLCLVRVEEDSVPVPKSA